MGNFIENATKAYIISYNTAMEMTNNTNMAMQVAFCVVMSYMTITKPQEMKIDPMTAVMMAVGQYMTQRKKADECEEDEDKENRTA